MIPLCIEDYPSIDPKDEGKTPNLGYGSVGAVICHLISGGAVAVLSQDAGSADSGISVEDSSRFPSSPFIAQVSAEMMWVTAVNGNILTVERGYQNTEPAPHQKGKTVFDVRSQYAYLLSPEPVYSIDAVYVDSIRQEDGFTAYTGRQGDEHPDYPGKAVITMDADQCISRQRNRHMLNISSGLSDFTGDALLLSDKDLSQASSAPAVLSSEKIQRHWAMFKSYGASVKETYSARVINYGESDATIKAVLRKSDTGEVVSQSLAFVPAGSYADICLSHGETLPEAELALLAPSGGVEFGIDNIIKTVYKMPPAEDEQYAEFKPQVSMCSSSGTNALNASCLSPSGLNTAWSSYADPGLGLVRSQTHEIDVMNEGTSDALLRVSSTSGGSLLAMCEMTLSPSTDETVSLGHASGAWDADTRIVVLKGAVKVKGISKTVQYLPYAKGGRPGKPICTSSAEFVIGKTVTADAALAVDVEGDFGGAGQIIERPDYVIKHYLIKRLGINLSDIDSESFDNAGAYYAQLGYKFGFVINKPVNARQVLEGLAFQCRSELHCNDGKWRLAPVLDSPPEDAVQLDDGDLHSLEFEESGLDSLSNDIIAGYGRDYSRIGSGVKTIRAVDNESAAVFGILTDSVVFQYISDKVTAESVLGHILNWRKRPLLRARFEVFYNWFSLRPGDAIWLKDTACGEGKFLIQHIRRIDKLRAEVRAVRWPE